MPGNGDEIPDQNNLYKMDRKVIKVKHIIDPHLKHKLVNIKKQNGNPISKIKRKYGKTQKNLHRDLIGFSKTKRRPRIELIGGTLPDSSDYKITKTEKYNTGLKKLARATGITAIRNAASNAYRKVAAKLDTKNPLASKIVAAEIAAREFIDASVVYKEYLLRMRQAINVIDIKILTPIITGSLKGKKGGPLFNDGNNPMIHESTLKYLYRLANLRENTYLDYIGKCSLSSMENSKSRISAVVNFFKKASGNLKPIDRYSGLKFKFFICKLYKLREAELEYNFRLQQFTQILVGISNANGHQGLQKYIKTITTPYNNIELLDIKKTDAAFAGYDSQISADMRSQKIDTEAIDYQDSMLSKTYYANLATIPANIERIKWSVSRCLLIGRQIIALQDEIHRNTGLAPNPELTFVIRSAATERLKDENIQTSYNRKLNDINLRIDNYLQYLLQSIDTAVNFGSQENTSDNTFEDMAKLRSIISFLDGYLNKLPAMDAASYQQLMAQIKQFLEAKLVSLGKNKEFIPTREQNDITNEFTKIEPTFVRMLLDSDNKQMLFRNKGILYEIWGDDTTLARKLLFNRNTMTPFDKRDMTQLLGKIREYYIRELNDLTGGQQSMNIQSTETLGDMTFDKSTKRIIDYREQKMGSTMKGGGLGDFSPAPADFSPEPADFSPAPADFSPEPNESYPASMTILPFGYPDDLPSTTNPCLGQQTGGANYQPITTPNIITIENEKDKATVNILTTSGTTTQQFPFLRMSEQTLRTFYGDMMFMLNNPMFFKAPGFWAKLADKFRLVSKTQKTKEVHRLYLNYVVKLEMGVLNFMDESGDEGTTPSRFPTGTAVNGYPAFVLMKLYWEYLELTRATNYSDFSLLKFKDLMAMREGKIARQGIKYQYKASTQPDKYKDLLTKYFGNAATSNYTDKNTASIPVSFLQIGLLNQDEILAISNLTTFDVIKKKFDGAVYKMVNARINQIRQNDTFIKQMNSSAEQIQIKEYTPDLLKHFEDLQLAVATKSYTDINRIKTLILPYLKPDGTSKTIEDFEPKVDTTNPAAPNIINNNPIYGIYATESESNQLIKSTFIIDFTPDINTMITKVSVKYAIGWALTGGVGCNRYKYKSPEEVILAYERGEGVSGQGASRQTLFNRYTEDKKNYIRSLIRAKFSMLRAADYNDTYFPMDTDGNINLAEISKIGYDIKEDTKYDDNKNVIKEAGQSIWTRAKGIITWLLKLTTSVFMFGATLMLAPILYILVSLFVSDRASDTDTSPEGKAWYDSTIKILTVPIWGPGMIVWKLLYGLLKLGTKKSAWMHIIEILKKLGKSVWSNISAPAGKYVKNIEIGKFVKSNLPAAADYESLRQFIKLISSEGGEDFEYLFYRDYNLDRMEFAMAYSYITDKATATPPAGATNNSDYTKLIAQMVCYYLDIYYQNDKPRIDNFKKFISRLKAGSTAEDPTTVLVADEPVSQDTLLYSLVADLIGKTDEHTQAVFREIVNVDTTKWATDFETEFKKIYGKIDNLGVNETIRQKIFKDIDMSKYYEPEKKLSLLTQIIKLSGCVRLIGCLHIIYDQYALLEQKFEQIEKFTKGVAQDLKIDSQGEIYQKIATKKLNPGNFDDLHLIMDSCGINLVQYYKTKLQDIMSMDRIELTGQLNKQSTQILFNRTITKLLMFLRLNLIFTDYIQFKTRYVPNPKAITDRTKLSVSWDDIFNFTASGKATPTTTGSTGSTDLQYYMTVFTNATSNTTDILLTSPYKTFEGINDLIPATAAPTRQKYFNYDVPIPSAGTGNNDKVYYYDGRVITTNKPPDLNTISMIILVSGTNTINVYYRKGATIKEIHEYDEKVFQDRSVIYTELGNYKMLPVSPPRGVKYKAPQEIKIDKQNGGNTIYYVDAYYPTRPIVAPTAYKVKGPDIFFHKNKTGGQTHTIWDDAANKYYVSIFPNTTTIEQIKAAVEAGTKSIPATTNIDGKKWTYSDFIWINANNFTIGTTSKVSFVPGTKHSGGASYNLALLPQSGGAIDATFITNVQTASSKVIQSIARITDQASKAHPSETNITTKVAEITQAGDNYLRLINGISAAEENVKIMRDLQIVIENGLIPLITLLIELEVLVRAAPKPSTATNQSDAATGKNISGMITVLKTMTEQVGKMQANLSGLSPDFIAGSQNFIAGVNNTSTRMLAIENAVSSVISGVPIPQVINNFTQTIVSKGIGAESSSQTSTSTTQGPSTAPEVPNVQMTKPEVVPEPQLGQQNPAPYLVMDEKQLSEILGTITKQFPSIKMTPNVQKTIINVVNNYNYYNTNVIQPSTETEASTATQPDETKPTNKTQQQKKQTENQKPTGTQKPIGDITQADITNLKSELITTIQDLFKELTRKIAASPQLASQEKTANKPGLKTEPIKTEQEQSTDKEMLGQPSQQLKQDIIFDFSVVCEFYKIFQLVYGIANFMKPSTPPESTSQAAKNTGTQPAANNKKYNELQTQFHELQAMIIKQNAEYRQQFENQQTEYKQKMAQLEADLSALKQKPGATTGNINPNPTPTIINNTFTSQFISKLHNESGTKKEQESKEEPKSVDKTRQELEELLLQIKTEYQTNISNLNARISKLAQDQKELEKLFQNQLVDKPTTSTEKQSTNTTRTNIETIITQEKEIITQTKEEQLNIAAILAAMNIIPNTIQSLMMEKFIAQMEQTSQAAANAMKVAADIMANQQQKPSTKHDNTTQSNVMAPPTVFISNFIPRQQTSAQQTTAQQTTAQQTTAQQTTAQQTIAQQTTAQQTTAQHTTAQQTIAQQTTAQQTTAQHTTAQQQRTDDAMLGMLKDLLTQSQSQITEQSKQIIELTTKLANLQPSTSQIIEKITEKITNEKIEIPSTTGRQPRDELQTITRQNKELLDRIANLERQNTNLGKEITKVQSAQRIPSGEKLRTEIIRVEVPKIQILREQQQPQVIVQAPGQPQQIIIPPQSDTAQAELIRLFTTQFEALRAEYDKLRDAIPKPTQPSEQKIASNEYQLLRDILQQQNATITALIAQSTIAQAKTQETINQDLSKKPEKQENTNLLEEIRKLFTEQQAYITNQQDLANKGSQPASPQDNNPPAYPGFPFNMDDIIGKITAEIHKIIPKQPASNTSNLERLLSQLITETEKVNNSITTQKKKLEESLPSPALSTQKNVENPIDLTTETVAKKTTLAESATEANPTKAAKATKISQASQYTINEYTGTPSININFVDNISSLLEMIPDTNLVPSKKGEFKHYFVVGSMDDNGKTQYITTPILDLTGELPNLSEKITLIYLAIQDIGGTLNVYCIYNPISGTSELYSELIRERNNRSNNDKYNNIIKV